MTHLKIALLVALGVLTSAPVAFMVAFALSVWRGLGQPPREFVIKYVERVAPPTSAAPPPRAAPTER